MAVLVCDLPVCGHSGACSVVSISVCVCSGLWPFRFLVVPVCGHLGLWPFRFCPFRFVAFTTRNQFRSNSIMSTDNLNNDNTS